jgi:hypothetical protein
MNLTYNAKVRVTPEAVKDRHYDAALAEQVGKIVDMTADCESAWVIFEKLGVSVWHHSELTPA